MKTMKKSIITRMLVLTLAISGLFVIGNNVYSSQSADICVACGYYPVPFNAQCPDCGLINENGNTATCYSTWAPPGFLQSGVFIWICGLCDSQVEAKTFFDTGVCNF
jgi:hypothetical protein